ncbi:nitroreductase family protein [Pseudoalteromonas denitrificans]|uniref:Nitroreductase n=1 Tax=Pseudoalteromonas denitrificans DSM 6059 TaxID=1123010 RepID=A0A1I1J035_9GAMM|nr:nitroreductase family protein [Pseudoalteromonas denitrificans]SFC41927.1 Nitroreductase [Pseudoalteromonas denitrificans DSM 6059]
MSLIDALNWRYAVKKFNQQTLNKTQIKGLIESVRLAPSAYGIQPYQLIIVENPEFKTACLPHSYGQDKVAKCSHLLVLAHKTQFTQRDIAIFIAQLAVNQGKSINELTAYQKQIEADLLQRSSEEKNIWVQQQCYIALGTLLTYAAANHIDACPMTGFDITGINQALGLIDRGLSAVVLCPVGIRAEDDHSAFRPKHRLSHKDLVVTS